jgi:hypothetical protein
MELARVVLGELMDTQTKHLIELADTINERQAAAIAIAFREQNPNVGVLGSMSWDDRTRTKLAPFRDLNTCSYVPEALFRILLKARATEPTSLAASGEKLPNKNLKYKSLMILAKEVLEEVTRMPAVAMRENLAPEQLHFLKSLLSEIAEGFPTERVLEFFEGSLLVFHASRPGCATCFHHSGKLHLLQTDSFYEFTQGLIRHVDKLRKHSLPDLASLQPPVRLVNSQVEGSSSTKSPSGSNVGLLPLRSISKIEPIRVSDETNSSGGVIDDSEDEDSEDEKMDVAENPEQSIQLRIGSRNSVGCLLDTRHKFNHIKVDFQSKDSADCLRLVERVRKSQEFDWLLVCLREAGRVFGESFIREKLCYVEDSSLMGLLDGDLQLNLNNLWQTFETGSRLKFASHLFVALNAARHGKRVVTTETARQTVSLLEKFWEFRMKLLHPNHVSTSVSNVSL